MLLLNAKCTSAPATVDLDAVKPGKSALDANSLGSFVGRGTLNREDEAPFSLWHAACCGVQEIRRNSSKPSNRWSVEASGSADELVETGAIDD